MYVPILVFSVIGFMIRRRHWDELVLDSLLRFYFIGYAIQGTYLGVMFGLSHYTMPRVDAKERHDWASWQ